MEENIQTILTLFMEKPYLIKMGANKLAQMFKVRPEEVREARNSLKRKSKKIVEQYKPKILIFDIETAPMRAYVWKRWKENISLDQTISEWFVLCFAAKWLDSTQIISERLTREEVLKENDLRITTSLWNLFDEADIVVAHNGLAFDVVKMKSRFLIAGLPPTTPYKIIDTLVIARKEFGFSSNKLDALAGYFGINHKDKTEFKLWSDCLEGKEEALKQMQIYNVHDTEILEQVYLKLRPWVSNHPNLGVYIESEASICPYCGNSSMVPSESYYYTRVNKYTLLRCPKCGGMARSRISCYPISKKKNLVNSL